jgi:predicted branched-subunit amino acid permease
MEVEVVEHHVFHWILAVPLGWVLGEAIAEKKPIKFGFFLCAVLLNILATARV